MDTTLLEITKLLESDDGWILPYKRVLDEAESHEISYRVGDYLVPESALSLLHPNFPEVVRGVFRLYKNDDDYERIIVSSTLLVEALRTLIPGTFEITDGSGNIYHYVELTMLTPLPSKPQVIAIEGTRAIYIKDKYAPDRAPMFSHLCKYAMGVPREHIDSMYPDWELRWNIGKELGLSSVELSHYAFSKAPSVNSSMTNITFE